MLRAWKALHQIQRDQAALAELPIAAMQALTANINRDPKKSKPFTPLDFAMYRKREESKARLSAEVAAVALALRHENRCPPLLITIWQEVLASATEHAKPPDVRALHSDDDTIWLLAPAFEGRNIRAGLIAVRGTHTGPTLLRDLDRPLMTYRLQVPERKGFGWLEAGLLLAAAET